MIDTKNNAKAQSFLQQHELNMIAQYTRMPKTKSYKDGMHYGHIA